MSDRFLSRFEDELNRLRLAVMTDAFESPPPDYAGFKQLVGRYIALTEALSALTDEREREE